MLPVHIPVAPDKVLYLLDLFLCSNPDDCAAISHRTYFQFVKADWDGLQSFSADVPWSSILKSWFWFEKQVRYPNGLTLVWIFTYLHKPTRSRPILNLGTLQPLQQQLPIVTIFKSIIIQEFWMVDSNMQTLLQVSFQHSGLVSGTFGGLPIVYLTTSPPFLLFHGPEVLTMYMYFSSR